MQSLNLDVQVDCIKHQDEYIPPLWIMCLESVAHLLVMINFSSNFLVYCFVSKQFKKVLAKNCCFLFHKAFDWIPKSQRNPRPVLNGEFFELTERPIREPCALVVNE